jgi:ribosomal protein L11 methyltransferase
VFSLLFRQEGDELSAELWEAGTAGIVEEPGGFRAYFDDNASSEALLQRFSELVPEFRQEEQIDWEQASREAFPALSIGQRFWLVPPWNNDAVPNGRLRLVIEPGMACGTGWHPCTQLCLEALEQSVFPGAAVLDIGSGSGILSEAARLLGAKTIIACDIDEDAIQVARRRLTVPMCVGSSDCFRPGWADVIVANISSAAAEEISPDLQRIGRPGAALILSGFETEDLPHLPFPTKQKLKKDGWACLIC